jgi:hypothetical protein
MGKPFKKGERVRLMLKPGGKKGFATVTMDEDKDGYLEVQLDFQSSPVVCMHGDVGRPRGWAAIVGHEV